MAPRHDEDCRWLENAADKVRGQLATVLIDRDQQIESLQKTLGNFCQTKEGGSCLLYGPRMSGRSAVIREAVRPHLKSLIVVEVRALQLGADGVDRLLAQEIGEHKNSSTGGIVAKKEKSRSNSRRPVLIVLEEIEALACRARQTQLYEILDATRRSPVFVLLVAGTQEPLGNWEKRVRSRVSLCSTVTTPDCPSFDVFLAAFHYYLGLRPSQDGSRLVYTDGDGGGGDDERQRWQRFVVQLGERLAPLLENQFSRRAEHYARLKLQVSVFMDRLSRLAKDVMDDDMGRLLDRAEVEWIRVMDMLDAGDKDRVSSLQLQGLSLLEWTVLAALVRRVVAMRDGDMASDVRTHVSTTDLYRDVLWVGNQGGEPRLRNLNESAFLLGVRSLIDRGLVAFSTDSHVRSAVVAALAHARVTLAIDPLGLKKFLCNSTNRLPSFLPHFVNTQPTH